MGGGWLSRRKRRHTTERESEDHCAYICPLVPRVPEWPLSPLHILNRPSSRSTFSPNQQLPLPQPTTSSSLFSSTTILKHNYHGHCDSSHGTEAAIIHCIAPNGIRLVSLMTPWSMFPHCLPVLSLKGEVLWTLLLPWATSFSTVHSSGGQRAIESVSVTTNLNQAELSHSFFPLFMGWTTRERKALGQANYWEY